MKWLPSADWKRLAPTVDVTAAMAALGPARKSWLLSAPLPDPGSGAVRVRGWGQASDATTAVEAVDGPRIGAGQGR